tara:strand:+ start:29340 stop:29960 length:621 start_codon:yes stop_codon:yes gene_type:complete
MAVSVAQICNLALAHIKQTKTTIANLVTDTGNTAVQCRIHYDVARQFVLADHNWNFATKRVGLTDISSDPMSPTTWGFRYDYPSDCLKIQEVERLLKTNTPVPYRIEAEDDGSGLSILTDLDEARAIYTFDATNATLFSPGFVQALSWYLASELAPALSGDETIQEAALTVYRNTLAGARAADSGEGEADAEIDSSWERARIGGRT